MRTTKLVTALSLGLVIGTNVQAWNSSLDSLVTAAAQTYTGAGLLYTSAPGVWAGQSLTAAGRALLDDADATAQRATLGLGTMATQAASAVAITGGTVAAATAITNAAVMATRTSAQTIQDANETAIVFDATTFATNAGMWAVGQPTRLVAPTAGVYMCGACITWNQNANGIRLIQLKANGSGTAFGNVRSIPSDVLFYSQEVNKPVPLAAGEYIEFVVYQTSGGPLDANANLAQCWMYKISA